MAANGKIAGLPFLLFFGLFWSGITLLFDCFIGYGIVQQTRALGFVEVPATITHSEVVRHSDSDGTTYEFKVRYRYTVNGEVIEGDRYRFMSMSSNDGHAHDAAERLKAGTETTAFYNPADPKEAVLVRGVQGSDLFLTLFMTPFNAVMLGLWCAGLSRVWDWWRKGLMIGKRVIDRPQQTILRTPFYMVGVAFAGAVGGTAFISIFVLAFAFGGFHQSVQTVVITWVIVLAVGVLAAVWKLISIVSGREDWVIDDLEGTFRFRAGRKERTLRVAEIEDISAETRVTRTKDGQSVSEVVVLRAAGEKIDLFNSPLKSRCEAMALWLKVRLGVRETSTAA